jgi:hypothetical protein
MWNAVQKGWAHPQQYAVCVRDHPKSVFEEMERLLLAVRYCYPFPSTDLHFDIVGEPAHKHSAEERETVTL